LNNAAAPTPPDPAAPAFQVVQTFQNQTDQAVNVVKNELGNVGGSFPAQTQQEAAGAAAAVQKLPALRIAATGTQLPALVVVTKYSSLINSLLVLEDATATGASDPTLSQDVRVLGLMSHAKEDASEQRAILTAALLQGTLSPQAEQQLTTANSD